MAKPSDTNPWATNVSATSDPGATRKGTGFVAGKKAPAKWFNYLFNNASKWFAYLDNLPNETDFTSVNFTWNGAHNFGASLRLSGGSNEATYTTPRSRTLPLDLDSGIPQSGTWTRLPLDPTSGSYSLARSSGSGGGTLRLCWRVPTGSKVDRIRVFVANGQGSNITATAYQLQMSTSSPYFANVVTLGTQTIAPAGAASTTFTLDTSATALTTVGATDLFYLEFSATVLAQLLLGVDYRFLDPGPRNF